MGRKLTNEEFQKRLEKLRQEGLDVFSDDVYVSAHDDMDCYCSKGHHWPAKPYNVWNKHGCPYCSRRLAVVGETDLWTLRPDVANMLKDKNLGYRLGVGSHQYVDFICPICGSLLNKKLQNVCNHGLACDVCGDGISYPNKFARALLKQLPVNCVKYEYSPQWLRPYRYDNYFEYNNCRYVLEMDGGVGHGNQQYKSKEQDEKGIIADEIKDDLASKHNINIIRVNSMYGNQDRFEYLKNSILNHDMLKMFDLGSIDWNECHSFAISSYVVAVADLYNKGCCSKDIKLALKCGANSVTRWLKQAFQIGLCNYAKEDMLQRSIIKQSKAVCQYTLDDICVEKYYSANEAERITGISAQSIWACCAHKPHRKTAGGFKWSFATDC